MTDDPGDPGPPLEEEPPEEPIDSGVEAGPDIDLNVNDGDPLDDDDNDDGLDNPP